MCATPRPQSSDFYPTLRAWSFGKTHVDLRPDGPPSARPCRRSTPRGRPGSGPGISFDLRLLHREARLDRFVIGRSSMSRPSAETAGGSR